MPGSAEDNYNYTNVWSFCELFPSRPPYLLAGEPPWNIMVYVHVAGEPPMEHHGVCTCTVYSLVN